MESETVALEVELPVPSEEGYTVYTKSRCVYCERAKEALHGIEEPVEVVDCDVYLADPAKREMFLRRIDGWAGQAWRTFPMVFHEGHFVGGYTDLVVHLSRAAAWDSIDKMA